MHIFIITQYFPPEIGAAASRWGDYSKILLDQSHKVTVLCETPHYPYEDYSLGYNNNWIKIERDSNFTIIRSKAYASNRKSRIKKIAHYCVFMISAIINSRKIKNYDLLIISSPPLFSGIIGLYLNFFFRKEYWLDIRDLWPDSALELNQISKGFFYNIGKKLENKIYKSAKGFIFPVPGFKKYFSKFSSDISKKPMYQLLNGVSKDFIQKSKLLNVTTDDNFTVLYSGNLGLAQDLETLIKAAKILKDFNIKFRLIGDGVSKSEIKFLAKPLGEKFIIQKPVTRDELLKFIKKSSVCLVPLKKKDLFKNALPSKMFEYMACAKPVIVSIRGEAEKLVNDSRCGTVIDPENPQMLSEAILNYYKNKGRCKVDGVNGMNYVNSNLLKENLISDIVESLKSE